MFENEAESAVCAIVAALILWGVHVWLKRPRNFPPGPIGLPVLGSALKLGKRADLDLMVSTEFFSNMVSSFAEADPQKYPW